MEIMKWLSNGNKRIGPVELNFMISIKILLYALIVGEVIAKEEKIKSSKNLAKEKQKLFLKKKTLLKITII